MIEQVLHAYGLTNPLIVEAITQGLINTTWKVVTPEGAFVVQKINDGVFKQPEAIDKNINVIASHINTVKQEAMPFVAPVKALSGASLVYINGEGFFRAFPFVAGSRSVDVVQSPELAYEAAKQFGRFTRMLSKVDLVQLSETIPQFHALDLRYHQFIHAVAHGNRERISNSTLLIDSLRSNGWIVKEYNELVAHPDCKLRVTHHDTKISNVLFDENDKGMCVIDLDTVMPGYFFSDVGDMMRTYLSPVSEEENDLSKIELRETFYEALVRGYLSEMKNELTGLEKSCFFFSGIIMTYMQAIRFLTDHLNNDAYYGAAYDGQNLNRAHNQHQLLQCMLQKRDSLERSEMQ